jgi:hypothetical protein
MSCIRIPNPQFWFTYYPNRWHKIAASICARCSQPIGYDKLAKSTGQSYEHSGRCPEKEENL